MGVLWCVFALYRLVEGLIGLYFLRAATGHSRLNDSWPFGSPFVAPWTAALLPVVAVILSVSVLLSLLVGYALLSRRPWGRVLAIAVAILSLLKFPLGTALGAYTLWVLAPRASGDEYEAIADHG
jgi:hypothetical protein